MLLTPEAKRDIIPFFGGIITANKAFSRQMLKVLSGLLPCGVLKQAALTWFSYGRGTRIYGSFLLYWADKYVS